MRNEKDLKTKLSQIRDWSSGELTAEYQRVYKASTLQCRSDDMLRRMIAYKWQEDFYGGLDQRDQKKITQLIRAYKKNPKSIWDQVFHIKPGTKLRRIWRGKLYEATALSKGFAYQAVTYGSLSEIATLITGVRWNGHLFFGIKKVKREAANEAA